MVKNQLFKSFPPESLCLEVVKAFGLQSFDDTTLFSKKTLESIGTVERLYILKPQLEEYYIPCKARTYLNDITCKNAITILRQILRCVDRNIKSKEKYIRAAKHVVYQIMSVNNTQMSRELEIRKSESSFYINFD
tara:strand:+ start:9789 stop:10193 length:405 start_codon:yes stop_codon:yes gene_type:complete